MMLFTTSTDPESGFTAVELLVTLIIASMFLFAGYQLYTQVQRDGADANQIAILSGKVNARLQETARSMPGTCAASDVTTPNVNETGIGAVSYRTIVSCPNSPTLTNLKLISTEASYGTNPVKKVKHATYSN